MTSTYTANNGIEKIETGAQSGTWGETTNTNFDIIDRALNGVGSITLSGTSHTLTTTDGSLTDGMFKVLSLAGSPTGTNTITISPNDQDKLYFVKNASGQSAVFSQGTGANVTIPNGNADIIFADGAGSGAAVSSLFASSVNFGDNVTLNSDNAVLGFGADTDVTITHDPDDGLFFKSTATGDDNPFVLTIQTGETDIAADDKLGVINFQAPDEGTGTDAILVAAGIEAVSEGDFSASSNATSLIFKTASSEAAAEKVRIDSVGRVNINTTTSVNGYPLHVGSSGNTQVLLTAAANFNSTIAFGDPDSSTAGQIVYAHNGDQLRFHVNGNSTQSMTIDSSGAVGIGAEPSGGTALDVRNDGVIQIVNTDTVQLLASNGGSTLKNVSNNPLLFGTNNTERMRIDSSGRVQIGVASATDNALLTIKDSGSANPMARIAFDSGDSDVSNGVSIGYTAASFAPDFEIDNGDNGIIRFSTSGTERMRIDGDNFEIGIGTTTTTRAMLNIDTDGSNTSRGYGVALTNTAGGGATFTLQVGDQGVDNGAFTIRETGISGTTRIKLTNSNGYLVVPGVYNLTTSSAANVFVSSAGTLQRSTSSRRYKNSIENATHGLTELLALRSVTYKGNNDGDTVFGGLIAEEVHDAGLTEFVQYNDKDEPDALAYGNMVSLCIKAIQEQQETIKKLEARITSLES